MLKKLVSEGVSVEAIAKKLGKQYPEVYMKMRRLGSEVDVNKRIDTTTSAKTGPKHNVDSHLGRLHLKKRPCLSGQGWHSSSSQKVDEQTR